MVESVLVMLSPDRQTDTQNNNKDRMWLLCIMTEMWLLATINKKASAVSSDILTFKDHNSLQTMFYLLFQSSISETLK